MSSEPNATPFPKTPLPFLEALRARGNAPPSASRGDGGKAGAQTSTTTGPPRAKASPPPPIAKTPARKPPPAATPNQDLLAAIRAGTALRPSCKASKTGNATPAPVPPKKAAVPKNRVAKVRAAADETSLESKQSSPPHGCNQVAPAARKANFPSPPKALKSNVSTKSLTPNRQPIQSTSSELTNPPPLVMTSVAQASEISMPSARRNTPLRRPTLPKLKTPPPVRPTRPLASGRSNTQRTDTSQTTPNTQSTVGDSKTPLTGSRTPTKVASSVVHPALPKARKYGSASEPVNGLKLHRSGKYQIIVDSEKCAQAFQRLTCKYG